MADLADMFSESICHMPLVGGGRVTSSLWHDGPLVKAPWGTDGRVVNIVGVDARLEEGVGHVELAEDFPFSGVGEYIVDAREGEVISDGIGVQLSVVVHPSGWYGEIWYSGAIFWYAEGR